MIASPQSKGIFCVIMAGGRGTRFWPLSRSSRPKQLLNVIGDRSMLQMTVDRLRKITFVEDIYIVCGPDLADQITSEIEGIAPENVIIEPARKNTAPCIGLAAHHLLQRAADPVMAVFPADHLIVGHRAFSGALRTAQKVAVRDDALVTIGVVPSAPHTGYGYIQFDKRKELVAEKAYRVKTFAEKPSLSVAKRFLRSGDFLWNSGMFVWKVSTFLAAMKELMPEHSHMLAEIGQAIGSKHYRSTLTEVWDHLNPESVDYGILEKAENIVVVRAQFKWSDVGSWNSYYELLTKNGEGNMLKGDVIVVDGRNNLIHSNGRLTVVVGTDDLVVINTEDATLVIPRERVEEVKRVVSLLQKAERHELL